MKRVKRKLFFITKIEVPLWIHSCVIKDGGRIKYRIEKLQFEVCLIFFVEFILSRELCIALDKESQLLLKILFFRFFVLVKSSSRLVVDTFSSQYAKKFFHFCHLESPGLRGREVSLEVCSWVILSAFKMNFIKFAFCSLLHRIVQQIFQLIVIVLKLDILV